jgi:hypothetical protein
MKSMKKRRILQFNLIGTLLIAVLFVGVSGCNNDDEKDNSPKDDQLAFEKAYVQSLTYKSNESIKLIGFKKIKVEENAAEFSALYEQNKELLKNYFYDKKNQTLLVYFPVEGALVEHHNGLIEASEVGELDLKPADITVVIIPMEK